MGYISPCLDGGVVKGKAAEMPARCAIEGKCAPARRDVGGVDGLLGGHPASLVDASQVLLDVLIPPEQCRENMRFDALACSVSPFAPAGADSVEVKQGCRGGLGPSARFAAGCDQPA